MRVVALLLLIIIICLGGQTVPAAAPSGNTAANTAAGTRTPPPSHDDWSWLELLGAGSIALAFLIALVYCIIEGQPLMVYRMPGMQSRAHKRGRVIRA
jgi:hypothetical protein